MNDLPRTVKILNRTVHNDENVSLEIGFKVNYAPGQFLMIWLPGINEKPFSISGHSKNGTFITARRRGSFSSKLVDLKVGDRVGVRGPYGRPFELTEKCCLVAGGIGLACLAPIAERYTDAPILYGETTAHSRIFQSRFPAALFYTDDGSGGNKGFPTDGLEEQIKRHNIDMVYCCGPEPMLVKAIDICKSMGVGCQVSIERYM